MTSIREKCGDVILFGWIRWRGGSDGTGRCTYSKTHCMYATSKSGVSLAIRVLGRERNMNHLFTRRPAWFTNEIDEAIPVGLT